MGNAITFPDQEKSIKLTSFDNASTRLMGINVSGSGYSCYISSIYALINQLVRNNAEEYLALL